MFNLRFSCLPLLFIAFIEMSMAGSNSLELTVKTTVAPGTCTMQLYDNNHSPGSTINIGDVYIPEVINKSKAVPFSLVFSDCTYRERAGDSHHDQHHRLRWRWW